MYIAVLDIDDSKTLSFRELQAGLRKLRVTPTINISQVCICVYVMVYWYLCGTCHRCTYKK